jgi:hypothetical protein
VVFILVSDVALDFTQVLGTSLCIASHTTVVVFVINF